MSGGATRVLVTGFGAFPNAPDNPTMRLAEDLRAARGRFARQNIALRVCVLPVAFGASPLLDIEIDACRPHALLHFGLAARRSTLTVETRAKNRTGVLHPDARGRPAPDPQVIRFAPAYRSVRFPVSRAVTLLRAAGFACRASIDAGDYVCNETLYRSLGSDVDRVGFIHVPRLHRAASQDGKLTREELFRAACLVIGTLARRP